MGNTVEIVRDPANQKLYGRVVNDSDVVQEEYGRFELDLTAVAGRAALFREFVTLSDAGLRYLTVLASAAHTESLGGTPMEFGSKLHPFAIYTIPTVGLTGGDLAAAWRRFRIRSGFVNGVPATGTDGADIPDSWTLPAVAHIEVPSGTALWYFWLEIAPGTSASVVRWGTDPTDGSWDDPTDSLQDWTSDTPWTTWPKPDGRHVEIGWVDTLTLAASHKALVRQEARTDMVGLGGATANYYLLKSVKDTYLVCHTWDPTTLTEGSTDVYVAKPPKLWETITEEVPETGVSWTYTYPDSALTTIRNRRRIKTVGAATETQIVIPKWCLDDIIVAVETPDTGITVSVGGQPFVVTLQQVADGRAWGQDVS